MYLTQCSTEEIVKIIGELKNGKSSDIAIQVIKRSSDIIAPMLTSFFNTFIVCFGN